MKYKFKKNVNYLLKTEGVYKIISSHNTKKKLKDRVQAHIVQKTEILANTKWYSIVLLLRIPHFLKFNSI